MSLRADHIVKVFADGTRALDGVSLAARPGRVLVLLGPSGCGKSTLLRIVAGLEHATSGSLSLDGQPIDDVPAGQRGVGFVFQNYALYPHLTVEGNLSLALEVQRIARDERTRRVEEIAQRLGIAAYLGRRPAELSGGQQQRVALGRALVKRPRLYLLDEPLSNLDALLREGMRAELKQLFRRLEATVIYVTHDQTEAMSLADEIAVMRDGKILQLAPPLDLYAHPADRFVASFVGSPRMTMWEGRVEGTHLACRGVTVPLGPAMAGRSDLCVGIRPEDVEISHEPLAGGWACDVDVAEPLGSRTLLSVRTGGEQARALAEPRDWPDRVWMRWPADKLHWFESGSGQRIAVTPVPSRGLE